MVEKASLKLCVIGDIKPNSHLNCWVRVRCQEHETKMIGILKDAC